jgi:hypothetical protein
MSQTNLAYEFEESKSTNGLQFFFISKGKQDIIKAIQYSFVQDLNGSKVYNLGFGDYDIECDTIIDNVNTNNGDAYKVFNTVLNTILIFFENFKNHMLIVQGSDGRPEFIENCKKTCNKNCREECRNHNRRINIYRAYVDKNYKQLSLQYNFLGGIKNEVNMTFLEPYQCGKNYDAVLLSRKSLNLQDES